MTPREKLDQAITEYVKSLDLELNIVSVNWVAGYEAIHVSETGGFSYTSGYVANDGLPLSGRIGITQVAARLAIDYATEKEPRNDDN